ncbi:outer membrane receptor for ferrienterochelin and colicins [Winogradskyella wandonensis]|uniref:Outer membrane receptor for ferrienterochelin and colicins n=1 Tax=Winogradskyella wandonensis TaxID=1442586 RepID=A0A4R1KTY4_9FLAO|nr:TonB-dependent receptor [Winogradskyella wandonensis]TCK68642.1 outer membrane receptor for ferrienterochelin and colicins [Winogradskyella wandonensis]
MSLNKNNLTLYFSIFLFFFSLAQQQQDVKPDSLKTENLEEVLITATRTLRQLSAVPLPVQIIRKKEIKAINSLRLSDILEEQTGLTTVPDFGGGEGIQMQGLDSQYTLILINGVPLVGRTAGTLDLNRISVGNIKQIEVIKGASSSLYGNEALAGVINIITERPKEGFRGDVNYRAGSFNTHDTGINLNYKKEKLGISTFINRNSSAGYDLNKNTITNTVDPFFNYTLTSTINYQINDKTEVVVSGRFYNQNQDEVVLSETLLGETSINEWNINLRAEHQFNDKWKSYLELYGSEYLAEEFFRSDISDDVEQNNFRQRFLRPELRATFEANDNSEFIFGLGLTNERLFRTFFSTTPVFNSPYVYTQFDGKLNKKINLILGARFDAHSEYASQFSPKAALQYKLNDKIILKSSVGYGFKAPDFRQLFLDFTNSTVGYTVIGYNEVGRSLQDLLSLDLLNFTTMPNGQEFSFLEKQQEINAIASRFNEGLSAESSVNFNIGADVKFNKNLKFSVNVFRNNISNLIEVLSLQSSGLGVVTDRPQLVGRENGQNIFSYQNRAEVYTQGLELDARYNITDNLTLSGGYQLLYAIDKEAEDDFEAGRVFARDPDSQVSFKLKSNDYFGLFNRSRHTANFKLFYNVPKWSMDANIRAIYRSKFGLGDTNGNNYLDRYDTFINSQTIVDLAINKSFYKDYKLGLGVDNLFNLIDQRTPNIPGRILYANLSFNF